MMIKNKFLTLVYLILLLVLAGSLANTVQAQGPDDGENVNGEDAITINPSGQLELTFQQLGYEANTIDRDRSIYEYRLELPGNFQILPTGNYLDLITSHNPAAPDKPAALQIEVNNQLVSTVELTTTNALSNVTRVDMPGELLKVGRNEFDLELAIANLTCEDPDALIELTIDPASTISFGYQQLSYPTDLSLYPFPFVETSLIEIPVIMVLPDEPTSDDLSIAATIAAGLGRMSQGTVNLTSTVAGQLSPDARANSHLIVIGEPGTNSLLDQLELPISIEDTLQPGQGILTEIVSPWNEYRLILVVSGLDNQAITRASSALNRQAHFLGMRGPVAIVLDVLPLVDASETSTMSVMTFEALGYQDHVMYGIDPMEYRVEFYLPNGWQLEDLPFLLLKFAHAEIVDPYESALDVELNGIPIGSTLLDKTNANEGELSISMPGHLLRAGRNRLTIGLKMSLPNSNVCNDLGDKRLWTVIRGDSQISLPFQSVDLPTDLRLLPYPFSQDSGFNQTLLVLPDEPSSLDFNHLTQLAVWLGSASRAEYISPRVVYASQVDTVTRENNHLILLGRPTENSLLAEINDRLPHPFVEDSDLLEPLVIDDIAFLPDPGRDAGLIQVIPAPWNEDFSLLAITGTTDNGVRMAFQTLLEQASTLRGNLAVVEPNYIVGTIEELPNQVTTYYMDTRPPVPTSQISSLGTAASEDGLLPLTNRWWR